MSTRALAVVALLGLLLTAFAAPAGAARSAKKSAVPSEKGEKTKRAKKTRKGKDTSLRGRFERIPTPNVPGAGKIRLKLKPSSDGDGTSGRMFSKRKLKAKGPTEPTFRERVLASTRKNIRRR